MRRTGGTPERERDDEEKNTNRELLKRFYWILRRFCILLISMLSPSLSLSISVFFSFNAIIMMNRDPFALTHITSHMRQGPFTQKITVEWMFFFLSRLLRLFIYLFDHCCLHDLYSTAFPFSWSPVRSFSLDLFLFLFILLLRTRIRHITSFLSVCRQFIRN